MATVLNPFVLDRYIGSKYFCDREAETALLRKLIDNGRNVTISAERRIGKTRLIEHFFASDYIKENYFTVYIDIYATSTLEDFVYLLSKKVYSAVQGNIWTKIQNFIKTISSLRVALRIDSNTGDPSFELNVNQITDPVKTLEQVFAYLDQQSRRVIVAIDEFQQVGQYPKNNTEALLRTFIQQSKNIQFIFAGSDNGVINNMFNSKAKPFYKSTQFMDVLPIPCDVYGKFAMGLFKDYDRKLLPEVIPEVYEYCYGVTSDIQVFFNELFAQTPTGGVCSKELIPQAINAIIESQTNNYLKKLAEYSERQRALIFAIARNQPVSELTSAQFISDNGLRSASSVQSAMSGIDKEGFLTRENGTIRISDVFFATWLAKY